MKWIINIIQLRTQAHLSYNYPHLKIHNHTNFKSNFHGTTFGSISRPLTRDLNMEYHVQVGGGYWDFPIEVLRSGVGLKRECLWPQLILLPNVAIWNLRLGFVVGEGMSLTSTYIAIQYWDITVLMLGVEVAMSHDIDLYCHPILR